MKAILPVLPLLLASCALSGPKPERSDEEIAAEIMKRVDAALEEQRREMMDEIREILAKKVVVEPGARSRPVPPAIVPAPVPPPDPAKPDRQGRARKPATKGPGFLGIHPSDTDGGVRIDGVIPGSAAERLQLMEGDLLTHVNGKAVKNVGQLTEMITALGVGAQVELKLKRNGDDVTATTTLGARPAMDQLKSCEEECEKQCEKARGKIEEAEKTVERAMKEIEKRFQEEKRRAEEEKKSEEK